MLGYIYNFSYVILSALSMVLIHHTSQFLSPALTLFLSTWIAIIFFHLINVHHLKSMYQKAWQVKWLWLKIMLTVALIWLCTIYGPAYVSPAIFISLFFSSMCLMGVAITYKNSKEHLLLISGAGVLICTVMLVYNYLHVFMVSKHIILGILMGLLGGILSYFYGTQSYYFAKKNQCTATQVLAIRFWLVECFCWLLLPHSTLSYISLHNFLLIVAVAFICLILPIFALLQSILKLGPEKSAIINGLIPSATYVLESILSQHFDKTLLLLSIGVGFFVILPPVASQFRKNVCLE